MRLPWYLQRHPASRQVDGMGVRITSACVPPATVTINRLKWVALAPSLYILESFRFLPSKPVRSHGITKDNPLPPASSAVMPALNGLTNFLATPLQYTRMALCHRLAPNRQIKALCIVLPNTQRRSVPFLTSLSLMCVNGSFILFTKQTASQDISQHFQNIETFQTVSSHQNRLRVHSAHLRLVFGEDYLPCQFRYSDSLDSFKAYYINKYTDHHSHKIAFYS
jgi:hypothetical protein